MLRRNARLRREYLYTKGVEAACEPTIKNALCESIICPEHGFVTIQTIPDT